MRGIAVEKRWESIQSKLLAAPLFHLGVYRAVDLGDQPLLVADPVRRELFPNGSQILTVAAPWSEKLNKYCFVLRLVMKVVDADWN